MRERSNTALFRCLESPRRPLSHLPESAGICTPSFVQTFKEHGNTLSRCRRPPAPARRPIKSRPPTIRLVHLTQSRNNRHADSHRPTPCPPTPTLTTPLPSNTTLTPTSSSSNTARPSSTPLLHPASAKPIPATPLHHHPSHSPSRSMTIFPSLSHTEELVGVEKTDGRLRVGPLRWRPYRDRGPGRVFSV